MKAAVDAANLLQRAKERKIEVHEMVDAEHRGDRALVRLSTAVEKAFIVRDAYDKGLLTQLGLILDDVIDLMRDVAYHLKDYENYLPELPQSSLELVEMCRRGVEKLNLVTQAFAQSGRFNMPSLNELADQIGDIEREADAVRRQSRHANINKEPFDPRVFFARDGLDHQLETITDRVKHAAHKMLEMARKEA